MTLEPAIEAQDEKASVGYSVVERVRKLCGRRLTDQAEKATHRLKLHVRELKKVGEAAASWSVHFAATRSSRYE